MQPGTRTESEVDVRHTITIEADPPASDLREDSIPTPDSVVAESCSDPRGEDLDTADTAAAAGTAGPDDYLLGTPAAGRVVTGGLVVGIAAAVGIVMVSVVAMLVTALVGTLIAYVVAHDDQWVRSMRRRRARRRQVLVAPRWTRHSWEAGHGVGRHAAT
ncbi:hypothetical protein ABEU20_000311 [Rhodococcus sp. PAM 2766]|uniref:DUF3040 domain-containing protein n=1 Tax=Rhodococcus parequi TaxID=3137122 RepID=A0ABW9F9T0_9NOCA